MTSKHSQSNRNHLTGQRGFETLLEICNLTLMKFVKFRQQLVGRLRLRLRFPFCDLFLKLLLGCAAYTVFR